MMPDQMQANRDAASISAPPLPEPESVVRRWGDARATSFRKTREAWPDLSTYERFEQVAVLVISGLVSVVIAAALVHLAVNIVQLVLYNLADPADQAVFQAVFGMVMTVLIALEFNHTILGVLQRRHGIVQLRTVLLIALLALVRKFIILDAANTTPLTVIGLAASVLALGAVYWLVRDQDQREAEAARGADGAGA
jgi:uncharacterized membrane protein (DUF373 family)